MKVSEIFKKIKKIPNIEIIIAVILCIVVVGVCLIEIPTQEDDTDLTEYIQLQQRQITNLLEKIDGVSNISVTITYTSGIEQVFAYNTSTETKNNVTTTKSEIIMVGDKPLVAQEILPKISGVVVVMRGDALARIKVIEALTTLLNVSKDQIKVYST